MGLLDLKTDLKSLKYGNGQFGDRRGNGWSGQPYITTDIPEEPEGARTDFLLRQGALTRSGKDTSRLTQLLFDTKNFNGFSFIGKQTALSLLNPLIVGKPNRQSPLSGLYNPANTIAQVTGNALGLHLEKQGILPLFDDTEKYFSIIKNEGGPNSSNSEKNRLVLLYTTKIKDLSPLTVGGATNLAKFGISLNSSDLFSYLGGPGGVRTTIKITNPTIKETDTPLTVPTLKSTPNQSRRVTPETTTRVLGLSSKYRVNLDFAGEETKIPTRANSQPPSSVNPIIEDPTTQITPGESSIPDNQGLPIYDPLEELKQNIEKANDPNLREALERLLEREEKRYTLSEDNRTKTINYRSYGLKPGDPDPINSYTSTNQNDDIENSDIIKFYMEVINNDSLQSEYLYFRAYIDDFSDSFSATWNDTKYVGRAENFYNYGGFNRSISLGFTIYAHSYDELIPIYEKLNQLAGIVSPDYSRIGFMRGNFIRLTVGDYLYRVPGIIKGFKMDGLLDGGWELGDGEQLPKHIKISGMEFQPIPDFVPRKGASYFDV